MFCSFRDASNLSWGTQLYRYKQRKGSENEVDSAHLLLSICIREGDNRYLRSQPSLKKTQCAGETGDWCAVASFYDVLVWRILAPLFNPASSAAGQFLGCKMAERRTEREDSEMSDFADSSQASGHNQDVETNDEFSDKVVEGKLLKYSSPNKI